MLAIYWLINDGFSSNRVYLPAVYSIYCIILIVKRGYGNLHTYVDIDTVYRSNQYSVPVKNGFEPLNDVIFTMFLCIPRFFLIFQL